MRTGTPPYGINLQCFVLRAAAVSLLLGPAAPAFEVGDEVRVTADRVNMRARPGLNYEVVQQVGFGEVLTVLEQDGEEWVGVASPGETFAWVHQEYVVDGRVAVARLNARSGPGINYTVLARLDRGTAVIPVETFGEWIKITAPADTRLWVHNEFLEPVAAPAPEDTVAGPAEGWVTMPASGTSTGGQQVVSVTRSPAAGEEQAMPVAAPGEAAAAEPGPVPAEDEALPYPLPEDLGLVPLPGQGGAGTYEGSLSRVKYLIGRPTRFELVTEPEGRRVTVCYVHGNREQLDGLVGRRMRITGKTYWVQDHAFPVIVPEKIHLDPRPRDAP